MPLSDVDRTLLEHCLNRRPFAWESFVDRYLVLVIHVIKQTARRRQIELTVHDEEDLSADVFLTLIRDNFAVLRRFRGKSSLATYLTVIARRVVVRKLNRMQRNKVAGSAISDRESDQRLYADEFANRDQVESMLQHLEAGDSKLIRMFHLEGKSYQQISELTGMQLNSIGPSLSRAREKMKRHQLDA